MSAELVVVLLYGAALVLGASVAWLARGETIGVLREQLKQARDAEAVATDRLVHAWKDGATIPPRPQPAPPPLEPLPDLLGRELAQWEDPEHRAELEAEMREKLGRGMRPDAILRDLENRHP